MRIFAYEMKKIWNWKVLLVIATFALLTWFALLNEGLHGFESSTRHGTYGAFQTEMFELYGDTLEPDELADFNFSQRFAEVAAAADVIVAREPVFAKYGITNFMEYLEWRNDSAFWSQIDWVDPIHDELSADLFAMRSALHQETPDGITVEELFASPMVRWNNLQALEWRYVNYQMLLDPFIEYDSRPVVVRAARELLESGNNSLIADHLPLDFSTHATITGIFTIIALFILITPLLIVDRSRKINHLQYSSAVGRKILRTQFVATIISALVLSVVLVVVSFIPYLMVTGEFWNTSIFFSGVQFFMLYDITFGQYVFLLAGMIITLCVGAACFAFTLARISSNIVNVMIKAVPAGVALAAIMVLSGNMALSAHNLIFTDVFRGRIDMPEVIVCGVIGVIGVIVATIITEMEKRFDVM